MNIIQALYTFGLCKTQYEAKMITEAKRVFVDNVLVTNPIFDIKDGSEITIRPIVAKATVTFKQFPRPVFVNTTTLLESERVLPEDTPAY